MSKDFPVQLLRMKEKLLWGSLFLYLMFLFLTVLIRSAISGITFDEAHTYLVFGRTDLFNWKTLLDFYGIKNSIANNHWLNSILINLLQRTVKADYNEFIIRLPSLFFLFLYIIGIVYGYRRGYYPLTVLIFFISNYYLLEFYGLARGYGMANTWVFFGYLSLVKWERSGYLQPKYLNWLMLFMSLAVLSNTVVLLLYPAIATIGLYRLIQHRQFRPFLKRCGLIAVFFLIFSLVMLKYHLNVSAEDKPLYTGGDQSFFVSVIRGYVWTFISAKKITTGIAVGIVLLICACMIISRNNLLDRNGPLMLVLFVLTNILMQLLTQKGYIATRVLIPFYAFVVYCLYELFSVTIAKLKSIRSKHKKSFLLSYMDNVICCINVILCIFVIILCLGKINIHATYDWSWCYKYKTWVEGAQLTGVDYPEPSFPEAAEKFYQMKVNDLKTDYINAISEKR